MDDPRKTPGKRVKGERIKPAEKKPGGRTYRRTEEAEQRILMAIQLGHTRRAAAAYADMHEDTLARWIREDSEFAARIKVAEGKAEGTLLNTILKAGQAGQWTAHAWILERRHPAEYGRKIEQTVTVKRPEEMSDDELDALLEAIGAG